MTFARQKAFRNWPHFWQADGLAVPHVAIQMPYSLRLGALNGGSQFEGIAQRLCEKGESRSIERQCRTAFLLEAQPVSFFRCFFGEALLMKLSNGSPPKSEADRSAQKSSKEVHRTSGRFAPRILQMLRELFAEISAAGSFLTIVEIIFKSPLRLECNFWSPNLVMARTTPACLRAARSDPVRSKSASCFFKN